jgi:hypothetical protein
MYKSKPANKSYLEVDSQEGFIEGWDEEKLEYTDQDMIKSEDNTV